MTEEEATETLRGLTKATGNVRAAFAKLLSAMAVTTSALEEFGVQYEAAAQDELNRLREARSVDKA